MLDDLQWADRLTLEFLLTIGPRLRSLPLLLICCYRTIPASSLVQELVDLGEPAGWLTAHPLAPIGRSGLARIAYAFAPESDPARLAELWLAASEGNPLVLVLLLQQARELGRSLDNIAADNEAT